MKVLYFGLGLVLLGVILQIVAQVDRNNDDAPKSPTYIDREVELVCYEGYSYIHKLGPTPLTLSGEKDPNCQQ